MGGKNRQGMEEPQVTQTLKRDQLGRIELLDGPEGRVVRRVACGGGIPGSRWLARVLMRRERAALGALAGTSGVARILDLPAYTGAPSEDGAVPTAADVLLRSWIGGVPLYAADRLPEDFFDRLEDLVRTLHRRGVCHNDLHKEPNVIVGESGHPHLIDFQLASVHPRAGRVFEVRVREDLRHVAKHRRRYLVGMGGAGAASAPAVPRRRSLLAASWMRLGKPVYNFVTRRLLRTSDGEPRRAEAGPWPRSDPPVGPGE